VFNPKQSINSLKKIIKVMAFLSGVITISCVVAAKPIARIFVGDGFESVKRVIQIGSPVVLFGVLNYIIGIIFMTNFGLKRQFSQAVIMTGLINVIVCFLLSKTWDVIGTAVALSFSEVMLCILLLYYVRSNRAKWAIGK
jgi:PST family polysaccharide transporter